jgi:hypothetical protein
MRGLKGCTHGNDPQDCDECQIERHNRQSTSVKYLVWSVEHTAWWKPNHCGYTRDRSEAGTYTLEEAEKICRGANLIHNDFDNPNECIVPTQEP